VGNMQALIVGAGGHARVIAEMLAKSGSYEDIAFLDDELSGYVDGHPVAGKIDDLALLLQASDIRVVIGIGDNHARKATESRIRRALPTYLTVRDPSAVVSSRAALGAGTVIMPNVVVNTGATVGQHVILNTSCSIDHDCVVEDFAHISPGAHLAGSVRVGEGTHVGTGVSVIPGIRIGCWSVIGAGSAVVRDVPDRVVAYGVPARVMRSL
jgi:acetyltransferase EpsM